MALFDNLSRMAAEASQKAVQKTKNFSDTSKLQTLISDAEKRINLTYSEIGKLYLVVHRDDPEPSFVKMVQTIIDAEEKINEYRKEIERIKGTRPCPKCGADVASDAAFCSSCGAAMMETDNRFVAGGEMVQCKNCGSWEEKGMRFCTTCGHRLADEGSEDLNNADSEVIVESSEDHQDGDRLEVTEEVIENEVQKQEVLIEEICESHTEDNDSLDMSDGGALKICPACGAEVDQSVLFCTECGSKFEE